MSPLFLLTPSPRLLRSFRVSFAAARASKPFLTNVGSAAAVGTVSVRSLIEPIRKVVARLRGHVIVGKAVDIHMGERLLEVQSTFNGKSENFYIPYDKLVIAVGSSSSTHGVPGLEHSMQLKTISDAQAIRRRILGKSI